VSDDDQRLLYERLVRLYWRELHLYALRLSGNRVDAEDVVQQAYLQAWRSISSLHDVGSARSWLYTITRRAWWRMAERREPACTLGSSDIADRRDDHRVIDELDAVQSILNSLEPAFRDPFLMVAMEGLSCQKTADELGIPLGTVLSRIARAREKLKCLLDGRKVDAHGGDGPHASKPQIPGGER